MTSALRLINLNKVSQIKYELLLTRFLFCEQLINKGIEVLSEFPPVETTAGHDDLEAANLRSHGEYFNDFDLIVDSIFGFSFEGLPRAPFFSIIAAMAVTCVPVISVDVPSGKH